jgi:DNA-binding LacI/PurR family transcriptional regulator
VLRQAGLTVPADISVTGYDDSRLARLSPVALTTIRQDAAALTSAAVDRVVGRLDHETIGDREQILAPALVVRRTTGPPRSTSVR